jgi:hypothetical protein
MIVGSNILAGASGQAGYFLNRSVRLRSSASAYFNRTPASASNRQTWTWSAWVKRGTLGVTGMLFSTPYASAGNNSTYIQFAGDILVFASVTSSTDQIGLQTSQVFRDPSAWYHIVVVADTTNATSTERARIYINGVRVTAFSVATYPAQNTNTYVNTATIHQIGRIVVDGSSFSQYFDGYLTEINFIDGQALTPTSFGEFNTLTGVWQPKKYVGTYGTNGFYLNFNDNSAATAAAIGKDSSGNGNNWTPNNISVTAGVTYDSMTDVPTLTSPTTANYPVMNPLFGTVGTLSNANLSITSASAGNTQRLSTMAVSSGKWYYEVTFSSLPTNTDPLAGFTEINNTSAVTQYPGQSANSYSIYTFTGNTFIQKVNNSTFTNTNTTIVAQGNIIGVALDLDNNKIWFAKNNVWVDSGDPVAGTNSQFTVSAGTYAPCIRSSGSGGTATLDANFGQRPFSYTPPTGFKALNTYNLPTPTISNGATQFAASIYTGTGATQSVTNTVNGNSFQPDFIWIKSRSNATNHTLFDSVRGINSTSPGLFSNLTDPEGSSVNCVSAALSNGFTISGSSGSLNLNTYTYVGWQWKASNATAVTNTAGSVTSSVSANTTAGFSIITFNSGAAGNKTVGHGLGIKPAMVIFKDRSTTSSWLVWHQSLSSQTQSYLVLQTTAAVVNDSRIWANTAPTSTLLSFESNYTFNINDNIVGYCFSEIAGYSKFGSYTGNGSANGTFVYTGFRPRWIMIKSSTGVESWYVYDSSRNTYNVADSRLYPNLSSAEGTGGSYGFDLLSNGFKPRTSDSSINLNGGTYIYAAFAENPLKYSLGR